MLLLVLNSLFLRHFPQTNKILNNSRMLQSDRNLESSTTCICNYEDIDTLTQFPLMRIVHLKLVNKCVGV